MQILQVTVEVLIAALAVVGAYCVWRLLADRLFGTDRILLAVEILTEQDAEQAQWLVQDALTHVLWLRSGQIFLLTTEELANHEGVLKAIRAYGVTCKILAES